MKCQCCENDATVHEVNIKGGKHVEKHLCEKCAREQGLSIAGAGPSVETLLESVISVVGPTSKQTGSGGDEESGKNEKSLSRGTLSPAACNACGRTFAQFRSTGVLGCPQCYAVFENQLGPLLSRAHEGGTHHVGKSPKSMSGNAQDVKSNAEAREGSSAAASLSARVQAEAEETERRLGRLRASLKEAVANEQYEKAAKIRDELHRLQSGGAVKGGSESKAAATPDAGMEPVRAKRKPPGSPDEGPKGKGA